MRYGSLELVFKATPDPEEARLVAAAIHFGRTNQHLPEGARFDDWSPTDATTEAEFRSFVGAAGLRMHSKVEGEYTYLILDAGASAVFDDGLLHSVRYRRADPSPRRRQMSVSLPESTLSQLRARADSENISLQELIQRVLSTTP